MDEQTTGGEEDPTAGAEEVLNALKAACDAGAGIEFYSTPRTDDRVSNQDILIYHKQGVGKSKTVRDVLANAEDVEKMGQLFLERFVALMKMHSDKVAKGQRQAAAAAKQTGKGKLSKAFASAKRSARSAQLANKASQGDTAASQGIASGLRAAAQYLAEKIFERVVNQKDNGGSPLEPVGEEYAEQRRKKYMIADNVVFQRTSQLLHAIKDGKYRLFKDPAKTKQIAEAVKASQG